jgi:hypothetical protein
MTSGVSYDTGVLPIRHPPAPLNYRIERCSTYIAS